MHWEKIKKRLITNISEEVKSTEVFPYDIDLYDGLDYLKVILEHDTPESRINGLADSVLKTIHDYYSGSLDHPGALNAVKVLAINFESYLRKVLYLIDKKSYLEISKSKGGLIPLINKLNLNENKVSFSWDKLPGLVGKPKFIEHICRTYLLRNEIGHHSPDHSDEDIAEGINSIVLSYLIVIFEYYELLLNSLPAIIQFLDNKESIYEGRIFPDWDEIINFNQKLTDGEMALAKFLDDNLPRGEQKLDLNKIESFDGWLIFIQPYLNGCRPDIIILNPQVGIQIFEVKDWDLRNYVLKQEKKGNNFVRYNLYVRNKKGENIIKKPQQQLAHYKEKIVGQLVPVIGENIDNDGTGGMAIKTSVYFHKHTSKEVLNFFSPMKVNKYNPIFGNDTLVPECLSCVVPDEKYRKSQNWNIKWTKEIIYWLMPPHHSLKREYERVKLSKKQEHIAGNISGHMRIRGVAGSGKTHIIAYCAAILAKQRHRVLVVSFNITLWHHIHHFMKKLPVSFDLGLITFNHFHGLCKDILNDYNESWGYKERSEEVFREKIPKKVLQVLEKNNYNYFDKFDAILIDEGQDYYFEWYSMLSHLLTKTNKLMVVCDKKQNIYNRNLSWLDQRKSGREQFGKWIELNKSQRMHPELAGIINDYINCFSLEGEKPVLEKKIESERPMLIKEECHVVWNNVKSTEWFNMVKKYFDILKSKKIHPSDIVILLPNKYLGMKCVNQFKMDKIETNHVFDDDTNDDYADEGNNKRKGYKHKRTFWPGDGRLKICTPHSFKGWEAHTVIIFIPDRMKGNEVENDRLIYTSITRARNNLIILNSKTRYLEFGSKYPSEWIDTSLF